MQSCVSVKANLNLHQGNSDRSKAHPSNLSTTAKLLSAQLTAENRELLERLTGAAKPKLCDIRKLLIADGVLSSKTLNTLCTRIKAMTHEQKMENFFTFAKERKPTRYEIIQPMDNAKRVLTEVYREKYGIDIFYETNPLGFQELSILLKQKLGSSGNTPFGLVLHSTQKILSNTALAKSKGNYLGHVTPFILQNTSHGFDVICLDSVYQPDSRLFECCKNFAAQGYAIRTMMTNTMRQADGFSCHTDALQTLKDLVWTPPVCQTFNDDGCKEKIAAMYPDFGRAYWPLSLMEFAGQLLYQLIAFWMLGLFRVLLTTVLPVLPSFLDRLSNRRKVSCSSLCVVLNSPTAGLIIRQRQRTYNQLGILDFWPRVPILFAHSC